MRISDPGSGYSDDDGDGAADAPPADENEDGYPDVPDLPDGNGGGSGGSGPVPGVEDEGMQALLLGALIAGAGVVAYAKLGGD